MDDAYVLRSIMYTGRARFKSYLTLVSTLVENMIPYANNARMAGRMEKKHGARPKDWKKGVENVRELGKRTEHGAAERVVFF